MNPTDMIERARQEWCEETIDYSYGDKIGVPPDPCPPAVVAALLDVFDHLREGSPHVQEAMHIAEAAIGEALK